MSQYERTVIIHTPEALLDDPFANDVKKYVNRLLFTKDEIPFDYEQKKLFVDVVGMIEILEGDGVVLEGTTMKIGRFAKQARIDEMVQTIMYIEHPKRFGENKKSIERLEERQEEVSPVNALTSFTFDLLSNSPKTRVIRNILLVIFFILFIFSTIWAIIIFSDDSSPHELKLSIVYAAIANLVMFVFIRRSSRLPPIGKR